jgi:hypothetical protein
LSYAEVAADARSRGWPVRELAANNHYAMLTDPERVAEALSTLILP